MALFDPQNPKRVQTAANNSSRKPLLIEDASWQRAPQVREADPNLDQASEQLAEMGVVGTAMLKEIAEEQLAVLASEQATPEQKARAKQVLLGGIQFNEDLSMAQQDLARGRALNTTLHFQPSAAYMDNRADEIANQMADHFSRSAESAMRAGDRMSQEPTFRKVLSRMGKGVEEFSSGIGRMATMLQGMGARARAIPGMVRDNLANGVQRLDDAINSAALSATAGMSKGMEALLDKGTEVTGQAWKKASDMASGVRKEIVSKAQGVQEASQEVIDGFKLSAQDIIRENQELVRDTVEDMRRGMDNLKQSTLEKVRAVQAGGQEFSEGVRLSIQDTVQAHRERVQETREDIQQGMQQLREGVTQKVDATRHAANVGLATVQTVGEMTHDRVIGPAQSWLKESAIPAIRGMASNLANDFKVRLEQNIDATSLAERRAMRSPQVGTGVAASPTARAPQSP